MSSGVAVGWDLGEGSPPDGAETSLADWDRTAMVVGQKSTCSTTAVDHIHIWWHIRTTWAHQ